MNLRLRTLLAGTFALLAALAVLAALAMLSLAQDAQWSASYLVDSVHSVESAERIAIDLHELEHDDSESPQAAGDALQRDLAVNRALIQSAEEEQIVVRLERTVETLLAARRQAARGPAERDAFFRALGEAREGQHALLQINLEQARGAEQLSLRHGQRATRIAGAVAALLVVAMAALIFLVRRHLIRPLDQLRESIQRLALGESGVRAPSTSPVELRELASTFNAMAELLDEQRRGRAEILGRVAGALEAPLASLRAPLERLSPAAPLPDEAELRRLHARIVRDTLQLEQRVGEFLDAARADAGELPLCRARCDLTELVREAVELFRGVSPAHHIELELPPTLPADADATRLSQVLHALLALSLRRAPGGGRVDVRLRALDRSAELTISAAEAEATGSFESLFNDLRQLASSLRDVPGVLFGLDVSRKLVEAHGGRLALDSGGTRFVLTLPSAPPRVSAAVPLPVATSSPAARS